MLEKEKISNKIWQDRYNQSYIPKISIMALLVILTTINMEYLWKTLYLQSPVQLYQKSLNRTNIIYLVAQINTLGYEKLDFLISKKRELSCIPKTMVFVNSINKKIVLGKYLRSHLSKKLRSQEIKIVQFSLVRSET